MKASKVKSPRQAPDLLTYLFSVSVLAVIHQWRRQVVARQSQRPTNCRTINKVKGELMVVASHTTFEAAKRTLHSIHGQQIGDQMEDVALSLERQDGSFTKASHLRMRQGFYALHLARAEEEMSTEAEKFTD